jgi:lipopolysaccharide/colanic/teichoic acid biosynthesis glycosyltransferase
MQLIVVREPAESSTGGRMNLLRYALSTNPLDQAVREGVDHLWRRGRNVGGLDATEWRNPVDSQWVLPDAWCADLPVGHPSRVSHEEFRSRGVEGHDSRLNDPWVIVTEGRFATCLNHEVLTRVVAAADAEMIAVNASCDLLAYRERVRLTPDNELVGFRRLFADGAARTPIPACWPHHLLVRPQTFETLVRPNLLGRFGALVDECRARGLKMQAVDVAGSVLDLESEEGVLAVCEVALGSRQGPRGTLRHAGTPEEAARREDGFASDLPRFIGPVLVGKRVVVEPGAVVVGPTVLCDDSVIARDAVVDSSIVGSHVSVDLGRVVRGCLAVAPGRGCAEPDWKGEGSRAQAYIPAESAFRPWSRFSYVRCLKRVLDVLAATVVLILFAPVFPVIALAVRMSSPGSVFFKDKRQGFHGRFFNCIKFRTMRQGADKIQEKLRFVCEVDGPQFKMADDPRITTVGRFLRETYLDEIPQFFNVLCGQMSVVGPRPSPESENTLCPLWRDARLSVRPGITGLWQVRRTRAEHKDFQEWIHYDTQYVRDLSPGLDLWICWRTFRRMVENFVNQF